MRHETAMLERLRGVAGVVQLAGDPLTAQARARRLAAQVRRAVATAIIVAVSHAALMPKLRLGSCRGRSFG